MPTLQTSMPSAVVAGERVRKAKVSVLVTNDGQTPLNGPVTVRLFTSADETLDGADAPIGLPVTKRLKIAPGASKAVKIKVSTLPVVSDGQYRLIAQTLAESGVNVGTDASDSTLTIAAPFVDLSGSFGTLTKGLIRGRRASVPVLINNAGNVPATGTINVLVTAGSSPSPSNSDLPLQSVPVKLKVNPSSGKVYKLKILVPATLPAGTYLHATIDVGGAIVETDESNNSISTTSSVLVVAR